MTLRGRVLFPVSECFWFFLADSIWPLNVNIGLFIPCYVDQFYPRVGLAMCSLLEHYGSGRGLKLHFPAAQTCCGQPMANVGCTEDARPLAERFLSIFVDYDFVVAPSGSCVAMVRCHYEEYLHGHARFEELKSKTKELSEFLVDVLQIQTQGRFPHKVGFHASCHGLRELRLGSSSEVVGPSFNKAKQLLAGLKDITFAEPKRPDECCGFGGTFAVSEEAVSCMMGRDRLADHRQAGAEVITAGDMSCLMHLEGLAKRDKQSVKIMHFAEILSAALETA